MTTVYFIRHAQADNSVRDGRNRPLTEKGLADRKLVTEFLEDKNIDIVLSSSFRRAVDTVADFAEKNGFDIELIEDFREHDTIGDNYPDIKYFPFIKEYWRDYYCKVAGDESLFELQKRNIDALHLVVYAWLVNSHGEFLITKRAPNKGYPNMWECTGGSAVSGDDSITAAVREVKEETGLDALPENGICEFTFTGDDSICDVWLFRQDFDIHDVVLQENETIDAKYATEEEIRQMIKNGEFISFHYIEDSFKKAEKSNSD